MWYSNPKPTISIKPQVQTRQKTVAEDIQNILRTSPETNPTPSKVSVKTDILGNLKTKWKSDITSTMGEQYLRRVLFQYKSKNTINS